MAIVWTKTQQHNHYEVRAAGKSRRLYRNGVLHTAYHPDNIITSSIWDLLFLPALLYPTHQLQRVLLLGVGGGAVIHLLNHYRTPKEIVGVEIDAIHLNAAKRFFNLRYKNLTLHHADAIEWVKHYKGEKFDLIIEDIFTEHEGQPTRLMHNNKTWLKQLKRLLNKKGMLVINNADSKEAAFTKANSSGFAAIFQFRLHTLQNHVLAFTRQISSISLFKNEIKLNPDLTKKQKTGLLRYTLRKIQNP
ncbi:MAG: methyltransferase domain-containing protein [Gammaproteobacteria bacterium]|nr:methyltransferase domain-containing protein [Gammaproteobacteria bacterium]